MKYVPLNKYVTLEDEIYKCVDAVTASNGWEYCEYCDFIGQDDYCYSHLCSKHDRLDQRSVIFILSDDSTNEGDTDE